MERWFHLWIVPKIFGAPAWDGWIDLGWHYMNDMQAQIFREALSCCAGTFARYSLTDQHGNEYAAMDCPR